MNFLIKTSIILLIISSSEGCSSNLINDLERTDENNLSSWVVKILPYIRGGDNDRYDIYGTLIHPRVVLTSSEFQSLGLNVYCIGGCLPLLGKQIIPKDPCQRRDISTIYNKEEYSIFILRNPFVLNNFTSVIKLAKDYNDALYTKCYFYAMTLNLMDYDLIGRPSKFSLIAPFKAQIINGVFQIYQNNSNTLTHVVAKNVNIKNSTILTGNYRASPVICQNKNNQVYEQLGFINLNFWRKPESPSIYYRNITNAWRSIYAILIDHFKLSEIVESLNNYQDQ